MTYESIRNHPEVLALLARGDYNLGVLGFTDHSTAHTALVADRAAYILRKLGFTETCCLENDRGEGIHTVYYALPPRV